MLNVLIMAGGKGTRFYPLSTEKKPKQFLNLVGDKTMIQDAVDRILPLTTMEHVFVATSVEYVQLVQEQLPHLPKENILIEPVGRNTAPCLVWAAFNINEKYPNSEMLVIPSDSMIQNEEEYRTVISNGVNFVRNNPKSVVTIGILPTRPETGYGYIKVSTEVGEEDLVKKVDRFVEKPCLEKAKEYYASKMYYWNAGMFIWNINYFLELAKMHMLNIYEPLKTVIDTNGDQRQKSLEEIYPKLEKISIDFALMEKINTIYVIKGDFGWDDLGSWMALERFLPKDENNNSIKGESISIDSKQNILFSSQKEITIVGLDNVFCIETDDRIVIGNKKYLSQIHELTKK